MKLSLPNITVCALLLSNLAFTSQSIANTFNTNDLTSTQDLVKAGEKYITLLGNQVNVGEKAPNFKVVDNNFAPVSLSDFTGQTLLISVVPSLDTGLCAIQTKRFNEESAKLAKNITILTISNDLPFAQKRFCKTEGIDTIKVLSDSVWREFGTAYGLLIKDMGILTRAILIINPEGEIVYKDLVKNISQHPDYATALTKVKNIAPVMLLEEANIVGEAAESIVDESKNFSKQ